MATQSSDTPLPVTTPASARRWRRARALLTALVPATGLSAAFSFSYLQPLAGVPEVVRLIAHGTLVPVLGLILLRRPLPDIRFSACSTSLSVLAVAFTAGLTLISGRFGFEQTYSVPSAALVVAAWAALGIVALFAMKPRPIPNAGIPGEWQLAAALVTAAACANPPSGTAGLVSELLQNFVLVGLTEEFAFRGVIQGYLLTKWRGRWLGFSAANVVTAILFAWMHNPVLAAKHLPWFLYLVPTGLFFGALRDRTGSWVLPGVAHGLISPMLYGWSLLGLVHLPSS